MGIESAQVILDPKCLYPTVTLESIENNNIKFFMDKYTNNEDVMPIFAILFEGQHYIVDGHHRMLAAIAVGKKEVEVILLQKEDLPEWWTEKIFIETLGSIGMRTIYDFEAIGNFDYLIIPQYYKKVE